jgi:large subunit ribosomal protein L31
VITRDIFKDHGIEGFMKKNIHPELNEVVAHCACGQEFKTRTTAKELKVTICSSCHPFFTGAQKFVDTAGRIEKFQKRYQQGQEKAAAEKVASENAAKSREAKKVQKKSPKK